MLLKENKTALGLEFYSISVMTPDEVSLKIVGKVVGIEEDIEVTRITCGRVAAQTF